MMGKRVIKRMQYPVKLVVLALFCLLSSGRVMAVSLADSPLFIGAGAEPNIMFVFDDSGSMRWGLCRTLWIIISTWAIVAIAIKAGMPENICAFTSVIIIANFWLQII